jgi:hypothetical protein
MGWGRLKGNSCERIAHVRPLSTVLLPAKPFVAHGAAATLPGYFFSAFSGFFGPSTGGNALM